MATLAGGNRVSESNHAVVGPRRLIMSGQNSEALGDNSAKVVWRVLGPHQLRRIYSGKQMISLIDVEISGADSCTVQVRRLLQQGFSDDIDKRADNGELAHFSLPKVTSAQCSIH